MVGHCTFQTEATGRLLFRLFFQHDWFRMACVSCLSLQVRQFWRASGLGLKLRVIYAINGNP